MRIRIEVDIYCDDALKYLESEYIKHCEIIKTKPSKKNLKKYIKNHFELNASREVCELINDYRTKIDS